MRKIKILAFATLATAVAVSCNKELDSLNAPVLSGMKEITINVNSEATKATLADDLNFAWSNNDSIAIYDGTNINVFKVASCSGNSAVFTGTVSENATNLTAVYPFESAAVKGDSITVSIPTKQVIPSGGKVAPNALVCKGEAAIGSAMTMRQETSLYKFTLSKAVNGLRIEGRSTTGNTAVDVTSAEGKLAPGTYYVTTMPDVTYDNGLSVTAYDDSKAYGKESSNPAILVKGGGLALGDITAEVIFPYAISSADEFLAFLNHAAALGTESTITLTSDIDFGNAAITQATAFHSQFDGQDHKVYGFSISNDSDLIGLFGKVTTGASIKNLTLGSADGNNYDGFSNVTAMSIKNPQCGVLAAQTNGALIENVTNFAPAQVINSTDGSVWMGGLIGNAVTSTINDCTNNGAVSFEGEKTGSGLLVGGIAGLAAGSTLTGCESTCNISASNLNSVNPIFLGGIVAKVNKGGINCTDCQYSGNMNFQNTNNAKVGYAIGGILGGNDKDGSVYSFENCTTSGSITVNSALNNWSEAAGVAGLLASTIERGISINSCTSSMNITIEKSDKLRAGGIAGICQGSTAISHCSYSGAFYSKETVSNVKNARNFGGILGNGATGAFKISECTFSGSADAEDGMGLNRFGGICGYCEITKSEISNCKTTSGSSIKIGKTSVANVTVGMILANATVDNTTISGNKIAGTIDKGGDSPITISAENLEDWMFKGSGTTKAVNLSNNQFNNE